MKVPLFALLSSLGLATSTIGQTPATPVRQPALAFGARPTKQVFARGEAVVLALSIRNQSAEPIFVSRLADDEFVDFMITGPDGKDVPWRGKSRIDSKSYSASDFAVLRRGEKLSSRTTVSLKNGHGFIFNKPGHYTLMAEYSLGPPEYFTPFAGKTNVPTGSFRSMKAAFCVEVCGPTSQK